MQGCGIVLYLGEMKNNYRISTDTSISDGVSGTGMRLPEGLPSTVIQTSPLSEPVRLFTRMR